MKSLRQKMISSSVMVVPYADVQTTLDKGACDVQVRRVSLQKHLDEMTKQMGYLCCPLASAELVNGNTQGECLAAVSAVLLLQPYRDGGRFRIGTKQDSLKWRLNLLGASERLAHWRLRLSKLEFAVVHRAGAKRQATDELSKNTYWWRRDDWIRWRPSPMACRTDTGHGWRDILCTRLQKCDVEIKRTTGKLDKTAIEKREGSISTVQPKERQATRPEVRLIEEFTVELRKESYCFEATTQLRMRGSGFYVKPRRILVWSSQNDVFLQKVVPVSLEERILHACRARSTYCWTPPVRDASTKRYGRNYFVHKWLI